MGSIPDFMRHPAAAQPLQPSTAAPFPSRLRTSGRSLVDASGSVMPKLRGFNVQPVPWAQQDMTDIYTLGGRIMRTIVFWDSFQPHQNNTDVGTFTDYTGATVSISLLDSNGIDSVRAGGYVQAVLDVQIQRQTTAGLYTIIDFPHLNVGRAAPWAADTWASYISNGQAGTQFLANRYGNPSSPQYTTAVVGFNVNEPPPPNLNISTVLTSLETDWRTVIGWVRTGGNAPNWIVFVAYSYAQCTLMYNLAAAGWTGAQNAYNDASTTAFDSVGGNVIIDLHDYTMCLTDTSHPTDGRQANGMTYSDTQVGGYLIGTGESAHAAYPPAGTVTQAQAQAEQVAFLAPYKQFCINANIPLMIGEWGWQGAVNTTGAVAYMTDKVSAWDDAGTIIEMQWDYDRNQTSEPFAARPSSLTGTDANGWLTATNTWLGLP